MEIFFQKEYLRRQQVKGTRRRLYGTLNRKQIITGNISRNILISVALLVGVALSLYLKTT
jgi:hypothetical protein